MDAETHELTRRRFTVHDYHRMGEAGILHEDDRVELRVRQSADPAAGERCGRRSHRKRSEPGEA